VTDNDGSDTGTLVFHIAGLNDAPVANDDAASTTEDAAVAGNVLANDTDVDVEPLTVANPGTYVGPTARSCSRRRQLHLHAECGRAGARRRRGGERRRSATPLRTAPPPTRRRSRSRSRGSTDAPVANDDACLDHRGTAAVSGNVLAQRHRRRRRGG
jgi:hypothetical protein